MFVYSSTENAQRLVPIGRTEMPGATRVVALSVIPLGTSGATPRERSTQKL